MMDFIMRWMMHLFALSAILLSSGCMKDLNIDPDTNFKYKGHWQAPIARVRINLDNLVKSDSLFYADQDGLVHVIYRVDSLFGKSLYEYTKIPDQPSQNYKVSVGMPPQRFDKNLETFWGAKLDSIMIEDGIIAWEIYSPVSNHIILKLKFVNGRLNNFPFEILMNTSGQGNHKGSIKISDLMLDLTQGIPPYNNLTFEFEILDAGGAPLGTLLDIKLGLSGMIIKQANGYFGQQALELPMGSIAINLGFISNITKGFYLADPRIKIFVKSNIGLPIRISPQLDAVGKDMTIVPLNLPPFLYPGSPSPNIFVLEEYQINNSNSNISNFIAHMPDSIRYSGNEITNPQGEPANNFIANNSSITVGMEIDLPLNFRTDELLIEKTIEDVDFNVKEDEYDIVEELSLGFRVENAFPIEANLQITFYDESNIMIDSAKLELFQPGQIDNNGNVIAPSKTDRYLNFTQEQIRNILRTKKIHVLIKLNTNRGGQDVKIRVDNYIDIIFGARIKMNIEQ